MKVYKIIGLTLKTNTNSFYFTILGELDVQQAKMKLTRMLNVLAKSSTVSGGADWCKELRQVIIVTDLMVHLKFLRSILATHSKNDRTNN